MKAVKEYAKPVKTQDEKYAWWISIQDRLLDGYKRQRSANAISGREYEELVREIKGGNCPQCGTKYKEVAFSNEFGMGLYWEPRCGCAPRCKCCHRILNVEYTAGFMTGEFYCPYCTWPITKDAVEKFKKIVGERGMIAIKRQNKILRMNETGVTCSACGRDLWYELRCGAAACLTCGRVIDEEVVSEKERENGESERTGEPRTEEAVF